MAELRQSGLRPDYKLNTTALSITYRNVGELKLDPRNPRWHSKKHIRQIAAGETVGNRLFRTLHELERLQRMRLGHSVTPPTILDLSVEVPSKDLTDIASPLVPSASILLDPAEPGMLPNDRAGARVMGLARLSI